MRVEGSGKRSRHVREGTSVNPLVSRTSVQLLGAADSLPPFVRPIPHIKEISMSWPLSILLSVIVLACAGVLVVMIQKD